MYSFGKTSLHRMEGVNPLLVQVAHTALALGWIDFGIPLFGGLRTVADQQHLFNEGRSKADGIKNKSNHQPDPKTGLSNALDVYAYVEGKASWREDHLTIVAGAMFKAALQLDTKIVWGGLWKSFKDLPHFQIVL